MLFVEEIELHDWGVDNNANNEKRREKSIVSYYLNKWYSKIEDLTFQTYIYPINTTLEEACPEILPFQECMVRYENKSPKDSEYWGPVTCKEEVINIFYTSLRCKSNTGEYLCIREWCDSIQQEFRCFWNTRLVAVGIEDFESRELDSDTCQRLLNYVNEIADRIPYQRCVLDIALLAGPEFKIIEFNSWETNSGAYPFDWKEDTEILYPDFTQNTYPIVFRHGKFQKTFEVKMENQEKEVEEIDISQIQILKPQKSSNWLVTDNYIYITTDIWLGRFTLELQPINWKRGEFRFCYLKLCKNKILKVGEEYLYDNFAICRQSSQIIDDNLGENMNYSENPILRYGFYGLYDGKIRFCRLDNNGKFYLV